MQPVFGGSAIAKPLGWTCCLESQEREREKGKRGWGVGTGGRDQFFKPAMVVAVVALLAMAVGLTRDEVPRLLVRCRLQARLLD